MYVFRQESVRPNDDIDGPALEVVERTRCVGTLYQPAQDPDLDAKVRKSITKCREMLLG